MIGAGAAKRRRASARLRFIAQTGENSVGQFEEYSFGGDIEDALG
jgi:hypothetical protein